MQHYLIIIHKAGSNYSAYSPDVLGCGATGETIEETVQNMTEVLQFHLDSMAEDSEAMPQPKGLAYYIVSQEPIAEPDAFLTTVKISMNNSFLQEQYAE